jgi:polysaccharide biosynthesis protein PslG
VASSSDRRGLLAVLVAFVISFVALLSPGQASAYAPRTSPDFFGVNGAMLRNFVAPAQAATLDGLATSMAQQNISWARLTFDQANDEKQRGSFNWYTLDTMVAALARHGVRGAASFVGTAAWAADPSTSGKCPWGMAYPADLGGWSDWVAAAARRYGPNGTFWAAHPELPKLPIQTWEVGNEVNSAQFWCPAANPEQYATVYSASLNAINAVDPSAKVIVAGLAPRFQQRTDVDLDVPSFLTRMAAADPSLRSRIPAVAIHPYASSVQGVLGMVAQFRQAMVAAGMPRTPMLVNEFGWHTNGSGMPSWAASEGQRARLIAGVTNRLWRSNCGVSGLAPYSWITMEQNPGDSEQWYGLADPTTGAPHPSGLAYGQQIRLALGRGPNAPPRSTVSACGSSGCARVAATKRFRRARARKATAKCRARKSGARHGKRRAGRHK